MHVRVVVMWVVRVVMVGIMPVPPVEQLPPFLGRTWRICALIGHMWRIDALSRACSEPAAVRLIHATEAASLASLDAVCAWRDHARRARGVHIRDTQLKVKLTRFRLGDVGGKRGTIVGLVDSQVGDATSLATALTTSVELLAIARALVAAAVVNVRPAA